ncbi:MAG: hypothetical protein QOG68_1379, partial [Solirubrobacteraceae bacterium]|nr:hypothetical protein [Solirubrobacteraceae bacterium]
ALPAQVLPSAAPAAPAAPAASSVAPPAAGALLDYLLGGGG